MADEDESLVGDLFATIEYETAPRVARAFLPWHRPRKQFVRRKQWIDQTRALLADLPPDSGITYLCLPGVDLLDLRAIRHDLPAARPIRFLGFNTAANAETERINLEVSLQEVKALSNVDGRSSVIRDDVRSLARSNSIGLKAAQDAGPFDVVNLDLCENVLTEAAGDGTIYDAIGSLFGIQQRRKSPWLLFITTRVDRATVDEAVREKLDALLGANFESCQPFSDAVSALLDAPGRSPTLTSCDDSEWLRMFCVGLSKWILRRAADHDTSCEVRSTMSYRVVPHAEDDDLVSVAFRLTPSMTPAADTVGLSSPPPALDECRLAAKLPARAGKCVAIDALLATNEEIRDQMTLETSELLAEARYSSEEYLDWALSGAASS